MIKAHGFDEALAIANNTEYGLTGAVYSRSAEVLNRAREEFPRRQFVLQPEVARARWWEHTRLGAST